MKWLEVNKHFTQSEEVLAWNGKGYLVGTLYQDSNGIITCESLYEVITGVLKFTKIKPPSICEDDYVICYGGLESEFTGQVIKQKTYTNYIVEDEVTGQTYEVSKDNVMKP